MANKITKREVIGMMMNEEVIASNEVFMGYLQNELALLDKKASNKKASKTQTENIGIKSTIVDVLASLGKPATVTEIQSANADLGELSNQKVSALLRQLIDEGSVIKTTDKKKSFFAIA